MVPGLCRVSNELAGHSTTPATTRHFRHRVLRNVLSRRSDVGSGGADGHRVLAFVFFGTGAKRLFQVTLLGQWREGANTCTADADWGPGTIAWAGQGCVKGPQLCFVKLCETVAGDIVGYLTGLLLTGPGPLRNLYHKVSQADSFYMGSADPWPSSTQRSGPS
ncbi:hypothetical protein AAFF_G00433990 [Aldrovandia affinis]|uniref:Uncharacterized protein n=1 Tax=Aldrovandia affinis TaxID=143900 RepID=A0AAD7WIB6_9TELE|nr:hypothetical protein AAFF_G00433990 [Aldrovandia affinis]